MEVLTFRFGAWQVDPSDNSISDGQEKRQMEPRAMDVLAALCKAANTIVSAEQLLEQCWGSTLYGDNPVHKIITQLRKTLGDKSSAPEYIETIRKRGYRTLAPVQFDYSETSQAGTWIKESSFRGLLAFDEQHAPIFFGRSDAIFRLNQIVTQQCQRASAVEFMLILGPSGSGKTSLVRAGLVPALMQAKSQVQVISHSSFDLAEKAEHSLYTCLAGMLLDLEIKGQGVFPKHSATSLGLLLQDKVEEVITTLRQSIQKLNQIDQDAIDKSDKADKTHRHSIFIDRLEVIFDENHVTTKERDAFLIILDQLARSQALIVLLACRNDFYPQIAASTLLMEAKARGAHFDLSPPSQAEIAQMIRLPALAARLTFGTDEQSKVRLDDVLCQDTSGNPDALPLLQYTLHELYRLKNEDGELSFATYHQLGGIEGAIGQRAEQVISALNEDQRRCLPQILSLVTTISSNDVSVTGRRATWAHLSNDNERAVVNALVESRLFVSELVDGTAGFGVTHEALLRRWPRVVDWIASHRSALEIRGRISELAHRWQTEAHSRDLLLPEGKQLEEARSLLTLSSFSLAPEEQALIHASSQRVRWRIWLRRAAMGAIITLAVLAIVLGISALSAKRQALERRVEVEGIMGYMLGDFVDKLRPIGKLDLLDSVGEKALAYFGKTGEEELSQTALTQRALALRVLAEVRFARGDLKSALSSLTTGNGLLLPQFEKWPRNLEIVNNLADYADLLGKVYLENGERKQSQFFFSKNREYSDLLNQIEPSNPRWWNKQSEAHVNAGISAFYQKKLDIAEIEFRIALELKTRVRAQMPNNSKRDTELASLFSWMGAVKKNSGDLHGAVQVFEQEAAVYQKILQITPGNLLVMGDLANALSQQGALHTMLGQKSKALILSRETERLLNHNLAIEPNNSVWLRELTVAQLRIQQSMPDDTEPQTILSNLEKIGANTARLIEIDRRPDWMHREVFRLEEIAKQLIKVKRLSDAEEKLDDAQMILENLLSKDTINANEQKYLASILFNRSKLAILRNNQAAANQLCLRARNLLNGGADNSTDYYTLDLWVRLNLCLNSNAGESAHRRLTSMGYQNGEYLKEVENSKKKLF